MKKYRKIIHLNLHWETKTNTDTDTLKERYANFFSFKVQGFLVVFNKCVLSLGRKKKKKSNKKVVHSPGGAHGSLQGLNSDHLI